MLKNRPDTIKVIIYAALAVISSTFFYTLSAMEAGVHRKGEEFEAVSESGLTRGGK